MRLRALVLARSVFRRAALHASRESSTVRVPRARVVLAAAALRHALATRRLRKWDPERAGRTRDGAAGRPPADGVRRAALGRAGARDAAIEVARGHVVGAGSTLRALGARRFGKTCRDLRTAAVLQAHAARAVRVEVRLAAAVVAIGSASHSSEQSSAAASGRAAGARVAVVRRASAAKQSDPGGCEQGANSRCFHLGSPFGGHSLKSYAPRTPNVSHSCRALFEMLVETHCPPAEQIC
jgi:hypothetical protein